MANQRRGKSARRRKTGIIVLIILIFVLLAAIGVMVLFLLGNRESAGADGPSAAAAARETIPETTVPTEPLQPVTQADANSSSIACKASYTTDAGSVAEVSQNAVAKCGNATLTNAVLQVYYASQVNAYLSSGAQPAPDFALPLDCQLCPLNGGNTSWQHYFLERAIRTWQAEQAIAASASEPISITEEGYEHNMYYDENINKDLPIYPLLYAEKDHFTPNSMHQAYLDSLPEQLDQFAQSAGYEDMAGMAADVFMNGTTEEEIIQAAKASNMAYIMFTEKSYSMEPSQDEIRSFADKYRGNLDSGLSADVRHALLIPQNAQVAADGTVTASEESWRTCLNEANNMVESWKNQYYTTLNRNANFARLANANSEDAGTQVNGGLYFNIHQGQLIAPLNDWFFASDRKAGDIGVVRSDLGVHIVFLVQYRDDTETAARSELIYQREAALWKNYLDKASRKVDYSKVCLWVNPAESDFNLQDFLYPDVAHERFPEVMVYLQQDYPLVPYGGSYVGRGGCGITTMAMLATHMTDKLITPAMMAKNYVQYRDESGTRAELFKEVPEEFGFFLLRQTNDIDEAIAALKAGKMVVNKQVAPSTFTKGGHYLLLQKYYPDTDSFQVRDSNLFNYSKEGHKIDSFTCADLLSGNQGFWIYQPKIRTLPACDRCGTGAQSRPENLLTGDFLCEKCTEAVSRRTNYLALLGQLSA